MWFDKNLHPIFSTSLRVMLSPPPLSLSPGLSSYFNFILSVSRSPIPRCYRPLKHSVTDFHLLFSFSFFQHLHINLRPSCLPSRGAGNGEKVAKEWLRCQFINTAHRETAWMKAPMPLENYPPSRGQVICYTVEHHNKHQHIHMQSEGYKLELGK